ncbi:MAG: hypothetical protein HC790_03155 [Acaryochloridaceae cyanobacterium CSU_3_4]|nr:hypothetical protein [Acaryochloridaceae cyanobacterium CSU_3_4]
MPKSNNSKQTQIFFSPAQLADLKSELNQLSQVEPGSQSVRDTIEGLMPLIQGCRKRGHSWKRIAGSFQRIGEGVSASQLRRYAYEFDPSLKKESNVSKPKQKSTDWPPMDDDEDD